jgi:Fe2+ transport system protein FeoA
MIRAHLTCPLCGHNFDPSAHLACQTCPLHTGCRLVCCPACGHTTVDQGQSQIVRWITSFLERMSMQRDTQTVLRDTERVRARQYALAELPLAHQGRVVDVSALPAGQREQLHGYGILPGCTLRAIQHAPVTIVLIEQTELAIETDIARAIRIEELA